MVLASYTASTAYLMLQLVVHFATIHVRNGLPQNTGIYHGLYHMVLHYVTSILHVMTKYMRVKHL